MTDSTNKPAFSDRWPRIALLVAALQCVVWGIFIILMPERSSVVYGFASPPTDLFLWQGTGLIIFLFGVGYTLAAFDPGQHWGIVLIGLLAKILGPIGMLWAVYHGQVPSRVLVLIPLHDILWWIPFALIIRNAIRAKRS